MTNPTTAPDVPDDATLIANAAALLARRGRGPAPADWEAECAQWIARSPRHAHVWALAQRLHTATAAHPALQQRQRRRRRIRRALTAAAACVCLAVLAPPLIDALDDRIHTGTAELRTVQFGDGSEVYLDAGTTLAPATDSDGRGARLLAGNAYFDVTRDPQRPFRVWAGDVEITVLGTGFSVSHQDDGVAVALDHGAVDVQRGAQQLRLRPGEQVQVTRSGPLQARAVATASIGAWRHGQLVADAMPVEELIEALQPHVRGRILLRSPALGQQQVTGVFDLRDPERALRAAVAPFGGHVSTLTPWLLLVDG